MKKRIKKQSQLFFYFLRIVRMAHKNPSQQSSYQVTFFNITPSPRDDRDINVDTIFEPPYKFPATLDWSRYLQPVRNQGVQGTSLAQAGACIVEWRERKFNKKENRLSPQFLFNHRADPKTMLMCGRDLMHVLKHKGCCQEVKCPYGSSELKSSPEMLEDANDKKIPGYALVQTIETLKMALFVFGPCVITFPVYNHTTTMWKQHQDEPKLGGHSMAVIGYNKRGFILRNSWGKYWQNNGNCVYPYEDWGYHDEVWCVGDEALYEAWLGKPKTMIGKAIRAGSVRLSKPSIPSFSFEKASSMIINPSMNIPSARERVSSKGHDSTSHNFSEEPKDAEDANKQNIRSNLFGTFFRALPDKPEESKESKEKPSEDSSEKQAEESPKRKSASRNSSERRSSFGSQHDRDESIELTLNDIGDD